MMEYETQRLLRAAEMLIAAANNIENDKCYIPKELWFELRESIGFAQETVKIVKEYYRNDNHPATARLCRSK